MSYLLKNKKDLRKTNMGLEVGGKKRLRYTNNFNVPEFSMSITPSDSRSKS